MDQPTPASDLPEWEPLTPEILEDEAIRGDVVLRWAVVGLALLWGCTEISDARVLVHVRSGEYLASHGVLPPATDPFSITAGQRRWVNLAWLFDLFAAGVNQLGPVALSMAQAVLAAAAFWALSRAVRPGIRTWWGSICGVLALLVVYPQFEFRPELVTLVGTAALLAIVTISEPPGSRGKLWWLPVLMLVWTQCDPRAWIGSLLIALYLVGQVLRSRQPDEAEPRGTWTRPLLAAIVVTLIHPFGWETWLAPWRQYAIEYPALRASYPRPTVENLAAFPLWAPWVWTQFNHRVAAAMILAAAAFVSLWLNRPRTTTAHWLWFVGGNLLGLFAVRELPVAAFVNCVLATVNGQEWYKQQFGQTYSVASLEMAFSRGGRAATVLGMLALAWLVISGRVDGPDGHRTGLGLGRNLVTELDSLRRLETYDDAGFHFTLRQGDALIAAGRRSFVDHRVALFAGEGESDLLARHRLTRRWFRRSSPPPLTLDEIALCEQTIAAYRITHALPRLNSATAEPDYRTFLDMLTNSAWTLTDILPAVAVFHLTEYSAPGWREYIAAREIDVVLRAFQEADVSPVEPLEPVRRATWSERWLSLNREALAPGTLEASHWLRLVDAGQGAPLSFQLGCCTLAVRAARQGTQQTPRVAEAYRLLGEACQLLGRVEAAALGEHGANWRNALRFYEAVAAVRQAAELQPDNPRIFAQLTDLWQEAGKVDCAYEALTKMLALLPDADSLSESERAERSALEDLQHRMAELIADVQLRSEQALEQQQDRLEVAASCYQAGCVQRAAAILQEDAVLLERQPQARWLMTLWLAELGEGEELIDSAARLQAVSAQLAGMPWQDAVAYAALVRSDYASAAAVWESALRESRTTRLQSLLFTAPMVTGSGVWLGDMQFPTAHLTAVQDALLRRSPQAAFSGLQLAVCQIERGDIPAATAVLEETRELMADSAWWPLFRAYWFCVKGELLDETPPHDQIPIEPSMFAPEPDNEN